MLLLKKEDFVLQSDRRVVKATDVATVKSAAEIIAAAEAEAARIREDAKVAFEIEKKRGYEKGLTDGKMEISMQKLDQVDQSVSFMESVEAKMADIVMKALKSFVVEIGDREMVGVVKERVAALRSDYPTVENFDVVEDPRLKGPACILETGAGVADASVETQLAAIEQSLARHISRS